MSSGFGIGKLGSSQPRTREVLKRYPKLRGYRFQGVGSASVIVSLQRIEKAFKSGDRVNPEALLEHKLVRTIKGKKPEVKILGQGELTKALTIEGCAVSKSVKAAVEKAGGSVI